MVVGRGSLCFGMTCFQLQSLGFKGSVSRFRVGIVITCTRFGMIVISWSQWLKLAIWSFSEDTKPTEPTFLKTELLWKCSYASKKRLWGVISEKENRALKNATYRNITQARPTATVNLPSWCFSANNRIQPQKRTTCDEFWSKFNNKNTKYSTIKKHIYWIYPPGCQSPLGLLHFFGLGI